MMKRIFLALGLALLGSQAPATTVADASFVPEGTDGVLFGFGYRPTYAQSFTVETTGTLDRVEVALQAISAPKLRLDGSDPFTLTLTSGPTATNLGTGLVTDTRPYNELTSGYDWLSWDLTANAISVSAGDVLAVVVTSSVGTGMAWNAGYAPDVYDGGQAYSNSGANIVSTHGKDLAFRSFVTPAPVPLPATGLLLVAALGGMTALRRRSKTQI